MKYSYLLSFLFIPHFKISLVERHGKEFSWKWCYPDFFTSDIFFHLIGDLYSRECSGLQKTQHFMITESAHYLPIRHLLPHTENKQKSHSREEILSSFWGMHFCCLDTEIQPGDMQTWSFFPLWACSEDCADSAGCWDPQSRGRNWVKQHIPAVTALSRELLWLHSVSNIALLCL